MSSKFAIRHRLSASSGFTLIELMVYVGLTAIVMGLFGAILITVTRIQGQQSASSQVISELSFVMTSIKRHIHESASVDVVSPGRLELVKDPDALPPETATILYDSTNKVIVLNEEGLDPHPGALSTNKITIDDVVFEKFSDSNNISSVAVKISITASTNTTNPQNQVTRTLTATAAPFMQSK